MFSAVCEFRGHGSMESGYPQVQVEASRSMPQHHKICQGTVLTCAYHEVVCNLLPCRARLEGCTEQARKQQQTLQDAKRLVAEMDDMGYVMMYLQFGLSQQKAMGVGTLVVGVSTFCASTVGECAVDLVQLASTEIHTAKKIAQRCINRFGYSQHMGPARDVALLVKMHAQGVIPPTRPAPIRSVEAPNPFMASLQSKGAAPQALRILKLGVAGVSEIHKEQGDKETHPVMS